MAAQSPVERFNSGPRRWKAFTRRLRELRLIARGGLFKSHPIMAHIIPIRRCNLACTYCNEYDDFSKPVPTDVVIGRINQLADLGTSIITLSGGEPLLHPDLDDIIAAMRKRGVLACMITNGYLLVPERIQTPEPRRPRSHADFDRQREARRCFEEEPEGAGQEAAKCWPSTPIFTSTSTPWWAAAFTIRTTRWWWASARSNWGFRRRSGIIHDGDGQLRPLGDRERAVYHADEGAGKPQLRAA